MPTLVAFVDFSKAFDRVDHATLLTRLFDMGVPGTYLRWLRNFLTDRSIVVRVGNTNNSKTSTNGELINKQ